MEIVEKRLIGLVLVPTMLVCVWLLSARILTGKTHLTAEELALGKSRMETIAFTAVKEAEDAREWEDAGEAGAPGEEAEKPGADRYCRVLFTFTWGQVSHYVPRGEKLGYLPLPEYGETQIPAQLEKRVIVGWLDEDGNAIEPEIVIDRDRVFTAQIIEP